MGVKRARLGFQAGRSSPGNFFRCTLAACGSGLPHRGACHRSALCADPLAPRNDAARHGHTLSRRTSSELSIQFHPLDNGGRREGRVAAAPGAPAQKKFARARKPQVQAVTTGLPCAVGYGLYVISSVNLADCHRRRPRCASIVANLSASLWGARTTRFRLTQKRRSSVSASASTAFRSTFVTTRTPLLPERNAEDQITDSEKAKQKYFFAAILNARSA